MDNPSMVIIWLFLNEFLRYWSRFISPVQETGDDPPSENPRIDLVSQDMGNLITDVSIRLTQNSRRFRLYQELWRFFLRNDQILFVATTSKSEDPIQGLVNEVNQWMQHETTLLVTETENREIASWDQGRMLFNDAAQDTDKSFPAQPNEVSKKTCQQSESFKNSASVMQRYNLPRNDSATVTGLETSGQGQQAKIISTLVEDDNVGGGTEISMASSGQVNQDNQSVDNQNIEDCLVTSASDDSTSSSSHMLNSHSSSIGDLSLHSKDDNVPTVTTKDPGNKLPEDNVHRRRNTLVRSRPKSCPVSPQLIQEKCLSMKSKSLSCITNGKLNFEFSNLADTDPEAEKADDDIKGYPAMMRRSNQAFQNQTKKSRLKESHDAPSVEATNSELLKNMTTCHPTKQGRDNTENLREKVKTITADPLTEYATSTTQKPGDKKHGDRATGRIDPERNTAFGTTAFQTGDQRQRFQEQHTGHFGNHNPRGQGRGDHLENNNFENCDLSQENFHSNREEQDSEGTNEQMAGSNSPTTGSCQEDLQKVNRKEDKDRDS